MILFYVIIFITFVIHLATGQWKINNDYNPVANPNAIIYSKNKKARFTVLTENIIRMEYNENNNFEDRASFKIINRYFKTTPQFNYTINPNNDALTIKTSFLTLIYSGTNKFDQNTLSITGYSDASGGLNFSYIPSGINISYDNSLSQNLFGTIRSLDNQKGSVSLDCIDIVNAKVHNESLHCEYAPFGQQGYALLDDSNTSMIDNNTNWISLPPNSINNDQQDWYFFGFGFDYKKALKQFGMISGSVPMIPRYMLGSQHCYNYDYNEYQLQEIIEEYQIRQIPIDLEIIDMDWHIFGTWGAYTWNYNLVPYPNITQTWFKKLGIRTSANLHDQNGIATYEEYYNEAAKALGITDGSNITANFTDYNYMMVLQDIILAPITEPINNTDPDSFNHGFDFWWIDWQQGGETGIYYSNVNPTILLNYVRTTDNIRKNYNKRGNVLSRYGGLGNQRYPHGFSGDVKHSWTSLAFQPYFTSTASNVAYGWSHDIRGNPQEYELNTRWIQWGVYSPMFRTHGPGGRSTPDIWRHEWNYVNIERYYVQQRQELLPYLYNLTYNLYANNIHLLRPMYYNFIGYTSGIEFKWIHNQYMLGDFMLVSPVTNYSNDPNGFNLTLQTLWIPPNTYFYEQHSGYLFHSSDNDGKVIQRWMDISEVPIYIKCTSNTIIPIQPFDSNNIIGKAGLPYYKSLRFDIYITPTTNTNNNLNGENILYEDDGYSMDYLNNKNVWTTMKWEFDIKSFKFNANISSFGNYNGFDEIINNGRYYSIRIYNVFPPQNVNNIYCNGNQLKYDKLTFLQNKINNINIGNYYYNAKTMSLNINCFKTNNVYNITNIKIDFADNLVNDISVLNGIKGKINRAYLAKRNLDEGTVSQDVPENNLTICASYMSLLNDIGDDYNKFKTKINEFNNIYDTAIQETSNLNPNIFSDGQQRLQYSINLLKTISQTE